MIKPGRYHLEDPIKVTRHQNTFTTLGVRKEAIQRHLLKIWHMQNINRVEISLTKMWVLTNHFIGSGFCFSSLLFCVSRARTLSLWPIANCSTWPLLIDHNRKLIQAVGLTISKSWDTHLEFCLSSVKTHFWLCLTRKVVVERVNTLLCSLSPL